MPISTRPLVPAAVGAERRAAARSRSGASASPAILTTSAPVARIARTRAVQIGRHAVEIVRRQHDAPAAGLRDQVVEVARAIRGRRTRRPASSASRRIRWRSSSEPANAPPSQAGRQVTITGRAPAGQRAGDVRIADRVEPQLDEIGVARRASRRRRSSAVVGAVTVTQSSWCRRHVNTTKKSLFNRSAEEARKSRSRGGRSGQGGCLFSQCSNTTTPTRHTAVPQRTEASKREAERTSTIRKRGRYQTPLRRCQHESAISP